MEKKVTSILMPKEWHFKLKRKALKLSEESEKTVTISKLILEAVQEKYGFKVEKGEET